jgi:hypothetical protein
MDVRLDGVLATVALKLEENDGIQNAGDIAASGKLLGFRLEFLGSVKADNKPRHRNHIMSNEVSNLFKEKLKKK